MGLTNLYNVRNSIDQGETITPLFWRIYYDPLINNIASNFSGYTLATKWNTSLLQPKSQQLQTSVSVLAYMDDTLWIAKSKEELQTIIATATSFYHMADIQINPTKSILTSNTSSIAPIHFFNSSLTPIPANQPFKFLGCWFTLNNSHTKQSQLIYDEAIQLINITGTKRITDKQAIYITNTVIIPTIEYRLHNIILKRSTCDNILSKYLTMIKHKAKLSRTSPNSTMLNPYIYNVYNIWDIQLQHHISCFQQRINDPEILGISTKIRLQQLQNNLWSATNILQHNQPLIDGPNKLTLNFKIIQLLQHLGISILANSNVLWPYTIHDGYQPLEPILIQHPKYNTFRKQLRKNNILYLEQLCTADNSTLLK